MLKAYIINLDRQPERLSTFYSNKDAHIFSRIPA